MNSIDGTHTSSSDRGKTDVGENAASAPISRSDLVSLMFAYLNPIRDKFTDCACRVELAGGKASYEGRTVSTEAFARPLWGLAPFWAGGGSDEEFERLYARGLAQGTDPDNPEWWGVCHDYDQRFVEMAAIAYGLMLAPHVLWDPLSERERANVVGWLGQINAHKVWNNNWAFFPILVNLALKKLGRAYDQAVVDARLQEIDVVWCGDGWYTDGPTYESNGMIDYYVSFAYHFYGLTYALCAEPGDGRSRVFVDRAMRFARDYAWLFSERGEAVPYGRSLTYRFAQSAFFSMLALVRVRGVCRSVECPLTLGEIKGLLVRNLEAWARLGISDNAGVLSIGYHYPNLHMAEGYNAPGSPYWALKAYAVLAIPEKDRFWLEEEFPHPAGDGIRLMANGTMLVRRRLGEVTVYVGGRKGAHKFAHTEEKYCKFAYSSRYGFSVSISNRSLREAAPDSMLAFVIGGCVFVRSRTLESDLTDEGVQSFWEPFPGIRVATTIIPTEWGHRRAHSIESSLECVAYDCGFAIPAQQVEEAGGRCEVRCVSSSGVEGETVSFACEPNSNLMSPKTVIHAVKYQIPANIPITISTDVHED